MQQPPVVIVTVRATEKIVTLEVTLNMEEEKHRTLTEETSFVSRLN